MRSRYFKEAVTFIGSRYFRGVITFEELLLFGNRYYRGFVTFGESILLESHYFRGVATSGSGLFTWLLLSGGCYFSGVVPIGKYLRDRQETIHGGVCMYVKETIPFSILDNLNDENGLLEVLWVKLRPTRLPRGISSIVAGIVYHPLKATNSPMLDYLTKCLIELEAKHPNCGIVVLEDLNQLNEARLKFNFNLKQIVHFPTRGKSFLDRILTNLKDYYDPPMERPKFGLSDHSSVEVQPKQRAKTSQVNATQCAHISNRLMFQL